MRGILLYIYMILKRRSKHNRYHNIWVCVTYVSVNLQKYLGLSDIWVSKLIITGVDNELPSGTHLLIWIDFNPSMDKSSHAQ